MSGVLQALGKYPIVFFKSEFGIIRDDDFIRIEIDGRLMQAISALAFVHKSQWIACTKSMDLICGLA